MSQSSASAEQLQTDNEISALTEIPEKEIETSINSSSLAQQLLNLITEQPSVDIISDNDNNQTVSVKALENQLQIIAASDISLSYEDFAHVVNTFSEQLNQHQIEQASSQSNEHSIDQPLEQQSKQAETFHLDISTFFSFTLLHKIGVLDNTLHHSEACAQVEPQLESLNQAIVFAPISAQTKKTPRRRASLHRANLQLNKKRSTLESKPQTINCLNQFNHDLHQWEHDLLALFMEASAELLQYTPVDFNRAIERIVTIHHHWRLLLQNHLKRLQVWLFNQLQSKQVSLANQGIDAEQAAECFEQLNQNAQTFSEQVKNQEHHKAPEYSQPSEQISFDNYLISRNQIQLLLSQPKLINSASPLLTNRVFVLYEPNHDLTDKLCHMLGLHQKLIDLFWYDVCHLSESICQLATEAFNQQTLQCFYQAQNFKNHLVNISVGIENLANQLHFAAPEVVKALARTQHHLLDLVHYQAKIYTQHTATIGRVTVHHSEQGLFAQLTQVEYAATLIELTETFDDIVAAISYRHCKSLDHVQLSQIQKLSKVNLDTLNQSMDNGYGNWLQLLNLLRSNELRPNERKNDNIEQSTQPIAHSNHLKQAARQALSELIEFGPLSVQDQNHQQLLPMLQLLACLDLNWSTPNDKLKPKYLEQSKLDNLLTALSQNKMIAPHCVDGWLQLLLPLFDYQTCLVTLAEQFDTQTKRKQDIVGREDIIHISPSSEQGNIAKLICQAICQGALQSSEKVILHAPSHLVIQIDQGQEHLQITSTLPLDQSHYQLAALLCRVNPESEEDEQYETWVKYQKAWFRCQADGIISVTISDKLTNLAKSCKLLIYSLD